MEPHLRIRDPKLVVEEIEHLIKEYKIDCLREFSDDFLGAGPLWMKEFESAYRRIKNKPLLEICVRADRITPESVKFLKKINTFRCALGIESFSNHSLARMRKGITAEQNKKAVELLAKNNIGMSFCIVLGAPGETMETAKKTVDFIQKLFESKLEKHIKFAVIRLLTPMPKSLCWDWLVAKMGKKYRDKDIIDSTEARHDWIRHFCNITEKQFVVLFKKLAPYSKIKFMTGIDEVDAISHYCVTICSE